MELSQLEVFLAVAREGRFSRAAAKLFRTQSAVSQSIRKLEEEIGEQLFDRSSRDGLLTDAGRVLQEYAERLLNLRLRRLQDIEVCSGARPLLLHLSTARRRIVGARRGRDQSDDEADDDDGRGESREIRGSDVAPMGSTAASRCLRSL